MDLDSTIFSRHGTRQQGATKGYNPRRPGRLSHHPLLAVLAEANFVLHAWLRSGNTGASQGAAQFLSEAISLLGAQHPIRCVRADSGFYADNFLSFLEERQLAYIVVARLTPYLKSRLYQLNEWQPIDAIYSVSEFGFKLWNWKSTRRFVVVREEVQSNKAAVGRKLIDLPGYVFRVFVTSRSDSAFTCGAILGRSGHYLVLHMSKNWRGYSQRKPLFNSLLHWPTPTLRSSIRPMKMPHESLNFAAQFRNLGLKTPDS